MVMVVAAATTRMQARQLLPRLARRPHAPRAAAARAQQMRQRWSASTGSGAAKDPWAWIKDPEHPKLQQFLEREHAYLAQQLAKPRFRKIERALYLELRRRLVRDDATIPERIGSYEYFMRQSPGANYQVYCRRHCETQVEETVLDQNRELALAQTFQFVTAMKISPNERHLLLVMENEHEVCRAFVKDLKTQRVAPLDALHAVRNAEWCAAPDSQCFYYTRVDKHRRPYAVYRYDCGTKRHELIYEETDDSFFVDVSQTKDGKFILINCNSKTTSEIYALASDDVDAVPQLLRPREADTSYFADHAGDRFYIVTNADRAANYKIVTARSSQQGAIGTSDTFDTSGTSNPWTTLLPESPDVKIDDVDLFQDYLVLYERVQSVPRIRVCHLHATGDTPSSVVVPLPAEHAICRISPGVNRDFAASTVRFSISTPLVPEIVYDYDMATHKLRALKEIAVDAPPAREAKASSNSGAKAKTKAARPARSTETSSERRVFVPEEYTCERRFVPSHSSLGVEVPLTLVHRRDVKLSGQNPTLLIGYGAYGTNLEAQFELEHVSLLERGWVIALAHTRGGGDLGLRWYHSGKGLAKRNTFDDYVSCTHHLLDTHVTQPSRLAGKGVSAGGLVMGYVANTHASLFQALVLKVPFLDILETMQDASLPLTVHEYEEWGNPADPAVFDYIRSYAPCENMQLDQSYPSMFVTGSMNDQRVQFWEPVKWVYKLRELRRERLKRASKTNDGADADRLLLLKLSEDDGHFGGGGRLEQLQESAMEMAFLYQALKLPFP